MPTITTDEAEGLLDDGVPFIDVRTVEEFQDGHVPGAINIPFSLNSPAGMQQNNDFVRVVTANFSKDQKLIVACKAGNRSARAAVALSEAGFATVLDMSAGFSGSKDAFGAPTLGWQAEGRDIEVDVKSEQTYEACKSKADQ